MTYTKLKKQHSEELNSFPMFFAFSTEQFNEGMEKLGLLPTDKDKIYRFGGTGGYYRKTDNEQLRAMFDRHAEEMQSAINSDTTGEGFILDMFSYELNNHEYGYTWDDESTLDALGITQEMLENNLALKHGLALAKKKIREN